MNLAPDVAKHMDMIGRCRTDTIVPAAPNIDNRNLLFDKRPLLNSEQSGGEVQDRRFGLFSALIPRKGSGAVRNG